MLDLLYSRDYQSFRLHLAKLVKMWFKFNYSKEKMFSSFKALIIKCTMRSQFIDQQLIKATIVFLTKL